MMNIGERPILSTPWSGDFACLENGWGRVSYVLEGNLNYTGAVITWMKDDLHLISSPEETEFLTRTAADNDSLYLVPAFTGAWGLLTGIIMQRRHSWNDTDDQKAGDGQGPDWSVSLIRLQIS